MLAGLAGAVLAQTARRPNIVFIISDDHHWQALGVAGNGKIRTPNLDKLARRGVYFPQGTISVAQCAPSRGVLLSGLEIYQNGLDSNGHTAFRGYAGPTVVEQMRRAGYRTALVGKWHIAPLPGEVGFAEAPLWLRGGGSVYQDPKLRRGLAGKDEPVAGHITDLLTDAAIGAFKAGKGQPQLLWLAYNAPHTPWQADERFHAAYTAADAELAAPAHPKGGKAYDWSTYYAVITHLDEAVGRLVAAIEQAGEWNNTLIVFLGDNGYLCGTKGLSGKVHPWEESVRVPYFVSGGLVRKPGVSEAAVASVDLPATFLDYAGVKPAYPVAGVSLRGVLEGGKFGREAAFSSWVDGRPEALAVRTAVEPYRAARTGRWKYIVWESRREALFDLAADGGEVRDLSKDAARAGELQKMRGLMRARMRATADPAAGWLP